MHFFINIHNHNHPIYNTTLPTLKNISPHPLPKNITIPPIPKQRLPKPPTDRLLLKFTFLHNPQHHNQFHPHSLNLQSNFLPIQ
ncbi:TasA family protein, partial [Siminovitchia fortis]|uniref:TasA family protein n=1 Tax=Siminovitchia fortis TaxID=254758 RepID=UPI0036F2C5E3